MYELHAFCMKPKIQNDPKSGQQVLLSIFLSSYYYRQATKWT